MIDRLKTVLVFGAGGQIGRELVQRTAPRGFAVVGLMRREADISDPDAVYRAVRHYMPDVVVNAAAYTAVDKAVSEPECAFAVNSAGPRHLALAARDIGASLVQLSTDYVFDGSKAHAYVEDDRLEPINVYGSSKVAGERAVRETIDHHIILRTAWVYSAQGSNFLKLMLRIARERDVARVVADQHGTPTAAADIANAIFGLLAKLGEVDATFGTFHLTNSGQTSWHGFAQLIFASLSRRGWRVPRLEAITTADYPTPARRPAMSVLDCGKIARIYGISLRPWQEALSETLHALLAAELGRDEP
jgi:dTDP-4-dehydrorhamnose reductase